MRKLLFIPFMSLMMLVVLSGCEEEINFESQKLTDLTLTDVLSQYRNWSLPHITLLVDADATVRVLEATIIDDRNRERAIQYHPYQEKVIVGALNISDQYTNENTLTVENVSELVEALHQFVTEKFDNSPFELKIRGNEFYFEAGHSDHVYFMRADRVVEKYHETIFHGHVVSIISGENVYFVFIEPKLIEELKIYPNS